jgi:hypothetical protein
MSENHIQSAALAIYCPPSHCVESSLQRIEYTRQTLKYKVGGGWNGGRVPVEVIKSLSFKKKNNYIKST